jgi:hypothetical protein
MLGHRAIVHDGVADTAQTCAEHDQDEGSNRCPAGRRPEEITLPHKMFLCEV